MKVTTKFIDFKEKLKDFDFAANDAGAYFLRRS